jgi:hypothetical protein
MNDKLEKARKGDLETQREVIDAIFNADSFEQMMSQLQPDDEQWLRQLANEKHDARAITLLLVGMENRYSTWDEEFTDEDTDEPFTFTHAESVDGETLFPRNDVESLRLYTLICQNWQQIDSAELYQIWNTIRCCTTLDYTVLLHHLADEANGKDAMSELAETYRYGDERNGIYINRSMAKKYYDMMGEDYDPAEDETEDDPVETDYTLKGNAETLKGIRDTINDLCQRFGTPDNEFGMFVPLQPLMKLLVGSDDEAYRGNVLRMEQRTLTRSSCIQSRTIPDRFTMPCISPSQTWKSKRVD